VTDRLHTKIIHEGQYAAEVDVELIDTDEGWSPYLSLEDAEKLDEGRKALLRQDLKRAAELARVFELTPVRRELGDRVSCGWRLKRCMKLTLKKRRCAYRI
jgi:hypothetical protein